MKISQTVLIIAMVFVFALGLTGPMMVFAAGPAVVDLLSITTNDFVILGETAITDADPTLTSIIGNVGLSSAAGSNITGLSCTEITGSIYDVDNTYTGGHDSITTCLMTPAAGANKTLVDQAVLDMGTAYVDGNTRPAATSASNLNVGGGTINGQNFVPGLYTWTTNVTITGDITLTGNASDIWIFQVEGTLDLATSKQIILAGGAVNSNVFWVVTGATTLFPSSVFRGNILDQTSIAMQLGATLQGRALAQTAVTLIGNTISTTDVDVDTTNDAPVITLVGSDTVSLTVGTTYTDAGATALDDIDGDITADIVTVNPVDEDVVGVYTITYNVSDSSGNAATQVTRTVNVIAEVSSSRSSSGGTHFGCKDINATNYEYFAASKPSLCVYATIVVPTPTPAPTPVPVVKYYTLPTTTTYVAPLFPNSGFAPKSNNIFSILISWLF